jgi:hypothetical protein
VNGIARRLDGSMGKHGGITDLVLSYKHFSPECHQVATADWHRCSLNRYLLRRPVNGCCFRSLSLKLESCSWRFPPLHIDARGFGPQDENQVVCARKQMTELEYVLF